VRCADTIYEPVKELTSLAMIAVDRFAGQLLGLSVCSQMALFSSDNVYDSAIM
jgi:hypothetical protein